MNNTGPGVRATAAYILEQGGYTDQTPEIEALNEGLRRSREAIEMEQSSFDQDVDENEEEPATA
ncbi:hypothetical protein [Dankookia sp. P2]|uniref:hypothetical protein n=1 Tax=Dankookia sp. P2 TaxID=3423955 RepID=UPI003D675CC4